MEEKENAMMNIHVQTVSNLVLKAGKYEDFRKKKEPCNSELQSKKEKGRRRSKECMNSKTSTKTDS